MKKQSLLVLVKLGLVSCVLASVACSGGSAPTHSTEGDQTGPSSGGPSSGSSSSGGSTSSSGAPSPGPTSSSSSSSSSSGSTSGNPQPTCVDVSGDWTGPVDGKAKGSPMDTTPTQAVTGTATVKLTAKGGGDFDLATGSQFAIDVQTAIGKVHQQEALQGTVKCGKLSATSSATVLGQTLSGTAECTFDANGCSGTFEVHDANNANVAGGTFKLAR
jgi:hypothetical protein